LVADRPGPPPRRKGEYIGVSIERYAQRRPEMGLSIETSIEGYVCRPDPKGRVHWDIY